MSTQIKEKTSEKEKDLLCDCCGNRIINNGIGIVNDYWLFGKIMAYMICPECHFRKTRQKIFLRQQNDL